MEQKTDRSMKNKKTDRRTAYTKNAVKDALLELLRQNSFDKITVAAVCREAEIGRATFYTHYDTLMDVIDELAEDAIMVTKSDKTTLSESVRNAASILRASDDLKSEELLSRITMMLPVCQRVADNPKYKVLFRDDTISQYILMQVFRHEKDKKMEAAVRQYGLSEKEAEMLFLFGITGAFSVNKAMNWKKDADWLKVQRVLLTFMEGGYEALHKL